MPPQPVEYRVDVLKGRVLVPLNEEDHGVWWYSRSGWDLVFREHDLLPDMSVYHLTFYPGPHDDPEDDLNFINRVHIETAPGLANLVGSILKDWSQYCVVMCGDNAWQFMSHWLKDRFSDAMHTFQIYFMVSGPTPENEIEYLFVLVCDNQKVFNKWLPYFWKPSHDVSLHIVDRSDVQVFFEQSNLRVSEDQFKRIQQVSPITFFNYTHGAEVVVTVRGETFRRRLVKALKGVKRRKLDK